MGLLAETEWHFCPSDRSFTQHLGITIGAITVVALQVITTGPQLGTVFGDKEYESKVHDVSQVGYETHDVPYPSPFLYHSMTSFYTF